MARSIINKSGALLASGMVAPVIMNYWDGKWIEAMRDNNIKRDLEDRYMDNIHVILMSIKRGWR